MSSTVLSVCLSPVSLTSITPLSVRVSLLFLLVCFLSLPQGQWQVLCLHLIQPVSRKFLPPCLLPSDPVLVALVVGVARLELE